MKLDKRKQITHLDFTKKPKKHNPLLGIARLISSIKSCTRDIKITKIGMEDLKQPYLLLANHASFNDFYLLYKGIKGNNINYVAAIDSFKDFGEFIMRGIGAIPKRKFISDISLTRNMKYSLDVLKHNVLMYPEARYTLDGTTSYVPPSLGKLVKYLNVPVVFMKNYGTHVSDPQFNKYKANKMPLETTIELLIRQEDIPNLSVDDINKILEEKFIYDDWQWLYESGYKLYKKTRANNLNAILYQCPNCKTKYEMIGEKITLTCNHCGKSWTMLENGRLKANDGKDIFTHIPDWFRWERENITKEVFNGTYRLESKCKVYTLPSDKGYVDQGEGTLVQDSEGTTLYVTLYGEEKVINYKGTQLDSVHVEYNYQDMGDALDFSIRDDSIWMLPYRKDILSEVSMATEAIRDLANEKLRL